MDRGYFDEDIIKTIKTLDCKYLIIGKAYPTLLAQLTGVHHLFVKRQEGRKTTELFTKLNNWDTDRRLVEGGEYEYFFFVTNTALGTEEVVVS